MNPREDVTTAAGADGGRRFARTTEDFACLVCGTPVRGDGYTNHCPACLWSRHVDVQPGDRLAGCGGLMRPVGVETRARETVLTHRCERCGHQRRNRTSPRDGEAALFALAAEVAEAAVAGGLDSGGPGGSGPGAGNRRIGGQGSGRGGGGGLRGRGRGSGAPRRRGRPR